MDNNQTDEKNIVVVDDVNGDICKSITSKMTINGEENNLKRKRVKPVQQQQQEPKKRMKQEPKKRVKQEPKKQEPKRIRTKKPTANKNLVERNYDALTVTEKLNCIAYCVQNLYANKI
jgi:FtsZ-interacting cell division protein YlmF